MDYRNVKVGDYITDKDFPGVIYIVTSVPNPLNARGIRLTVFADPNGMVEEPDRLSYSAEVWDEYLSPLDLKIRLDACCYWTEHPIYCRCKEVV